MIFEQLNSPRMKKSLELLNDIHRQYPGERVLVFSQFKKFLDMVARAIKLGDQADFDVYRYDGSILSNVVREGNYY